MIFQRILPFISLNVHLLLSLRIHTDTYRFNFFLEVQSSLKLLPFFFYLIFISINKRRKVSLTNRRTLYRISQLLVSLFNLSHVLFFVSFYYSVVDFSFIFMVFLENIFLKFLLLFQLPVFLLHL